MPDKVKNFSDIKNKIQQVQQKYEQTSQVELAESDPVEFYNRLLDPQFILDVQTDIADIINNSELIKKYDPLTMACGMMGLLEDTFGAMIADAVYASIMAAMPEITPEELAVKADEQNMIISERILEIRSYIAEQINERQKAQMNKIKADIEAGKEPSVTADKPADDVMAISSILRQAIMIMVSSTREFVERNLITSK